MRRDERKHLPGCECRLKACRDLASLPTVRLRAEEQIRPDKRAVLARFATLVAMRSSIVQVAADECRVESPEGEILILRCTPTVLACLAGAERLPPPITAPGETWGAPHVTGGGRAEGADGR
jgi:hypothetical protein